MAKKVKGETKQGKIIAKEEKERSLMEKLGFVQMMFDFYTSPVS